MAPPPRPLPLLRPAALALLALLLLLAFPPTPSARGQGGPPGPMGPGAPAPHWAWLAGNTQPAIEVKWAPGVSTEERALVEPLLPSTLALAVTAEGQQPRDRDVGGSAFVASEDGILVTNWHILSMLGSSRILWARTPGGTWYEARPLGATWWADVGMARLPPVRPAWKPVTWADAEPRSRGRRFFAVGSPMGRPHVVSGGRLGSLVYFDPSAREGRVEIRARGGRPGRRGALIGLHFSDDLSMSGGSGSPVFDEEGRCVGIVSAGDMSRSADELAYVRPASLIRPLVDLIRREARFDPPDLGVRLGPSPMPPGMSVRIPRELRTARRRARGGALVTTVHERGPAAGRLRSGDILLAIDGRVLFGEVYESRALALLPLEPDVPCEVEILRGGRRKTVEITPLRGWSIYDDFDREHDARAPAFRMPGMR